MFGRQIIDDGRSPDFLTGMPLETDAEYSKRLLAAMAVDASVFTAAYQAIALATPLGVEWSISEALGRDPSMPSIVNVDTDRALTGVERQNIIDAANKWMMVPGFKIAFTP
jgi:hypothetical protein